MEAAFDKLQKEGKNNVDNLVKWMKDAKIIDKKKETEDKVRSFFDDVADKKNVPVEKFKEVLTKVADEFKANFEGMSKQLAETGPKFLQNCLGGATSALTGAVKDLFCKK